MNDLPELKIFIDDFPPLFRSIDFFKKADANMNKKDWGLGDLALVILAGVNLGIRVVKTYNDGEKLVNALMSPKPVLMSIPARVYFPVQNRVTVRRKSRRNLATRKVLHKH